MEGCHCTGWQTQQKLEEGPRGRKELNRSSHRAVGVGPECARQLCVTVTEYLRKKNKKGRTFDDSWFPVSWLHHFLDCSEGEQHSRTVWQSHVAHLTAAWKQGERSWKQNMLCKGMLPMIFFLKQAPPPDSPFRSSIVNLSMDSLMDKVTSFTSNHCSVTLPTGAKPSALAFKDVFKPKP